MKPWVCLISTALLLANATSAVSQAADAPRSRINLVLDASGSMWGQIQGKPKIDIARDVIQKLLADIKSDTHMGLTVYGHRRKGDCGDIEQLIAAGPLDASAFMNTVRGIQPKGKTPMTAAVKQAAEALKFSEESATVILVSDGEETCDLDPCSVAKQLEETGVDLTVHVVGFGVTEKNKKAFDQLQCLAKNTGGEFFSARDAQGLQLALSKAVKQAEAPITGLQLRALLKEGGAEITKGLTWEVFKSKPDALGKYERVTYSYHAKPLIRLATGEYRVRVRFGAAQTEKTVSVAGDRLIKDTLVLQAGRLKVRALLKAGSEPIDKGLSWEVHTAKTDELGQRKRVTYSYESQPLVVLGQGDYLVSVRHGSAQASQEITIQADQLHKIDLVLGAGQLRAQAVFAEGSPPIEKGLSWEVHEGKADALGDRKRISYSYDKRPVFKLPAGEFRLSVRHGSASQSRKVLVSASELTDVTLVLGAGQLRAQAMLSPGATALTKNLSWEVHQVKPDTGERGKRVTHSYDKQPVFKLPVGKYLLSVKYGSASGAETVEVKANALTESSLVLDAGQIKLSAVLANGGSILARGLSWEVVSLNTQTGEPGKRIAHSYNAQPVFTLAAGRYRLSVKLGAAVVTQAVEIAAGKQGREQLVLNAGQVKLRAVTQAGSTSIAQGLSWELYSLRDGQPDARAGHSYSAEPKFTLVAGRYRVQVKTKQGTGKVDFEIAAGKSLAQEIQVTPQ